MLHIHKIKTGPMGVNTYIVKCDITDECIVVDPGGNAEYILATAQDDLGGKIIGIVLTHGHFDHIGALDKLRDLAGVGASIHKVDAWMLEDALGNLSAMVGQPFVCRKAEKLLQDGDLVRVGTCNLSVLETPGHTQGGICLSGEGFVLSGDTLFDGDIGRTDFPKGDFDTLKRSIRQRLYTLDDATIVYPGHEGETTIGKEKKTNHYVREVGY